MNFHFEMYTDEPRIDTDSVKMVKWGQIRSAGVICTLRPWLWAIGIKLDIKLISFPLKYIIYLFFLSECLLVSDNEPLVGPYSIT